MTVEIEEITGRSRQGMTEPYICIGDDGHTYFVKGCGATRKGQINEWICGNLARRFGLPIPEFEIVEVPSSLMNISSDIDLSELGAGPAFGSQKVLSHELSFSNVPNVPVALRQDVFMFDWWVLNGDRKLTEQGGNPNLFWDPDAWELVVFDHNLAFDKTVQKQELLRDHVFSGEVDRSLMLDFFRKDEFVERMGKVLDGWGDIVSAVPDEWEYIDPEMTVVTDYAYGDVFELLKRYENEDFWNWQ